MNDERIAKQHLFIAGSLLIAGIALFIAATCLCGLALWRYLFDLPIGNSFKLGLVAWVLLMPVHVGTLINLKVLEQRLERDLED